MGSRQFGISVDGSGGKTARRLFVALIFGLGVFPPFLDIGHVPAADRQNRETIGGQEQRWPQVAGLSQPPKRLSPRFN